MKIYEGVNRETQQVSVAYQLAKISKDNEFRASSFVDNRSEAIQMRKLQEIANNSTKKAPYHLVDNQQNVAQMKPLLELPGRKNNPVIQMNKGKGIYHILKDNTNVRKNEPDEKYPVDRQLQSGTEVKVVNTALPSKFKAGWFKNEHSWIIFPPWAPDENPGNDVITGWVEDSKLGRKSGTVATEFKKGDKLYGLHKEGRKKYTDGEVYGKNNIANSKNHTIDELNIALGSKRSKDSVKLEEDEELLAYKKFIKQNNIKQKTEDLCKAGIKFTTERGHMVHFLYDGLDPKEVVGGAEGKEHYYAYTSKEMRSLMRAKLLEEGVVPKNEATRASRKVDLTKVKFYDKGLPAGAPWGSNAPDGWKNVYNDYKNEKLASPKYQNLKDKGK